MKNENYYTHYVETLTNTMTDAIIRNVSLQASVRVSEETIKDYEKTIELLDAEIGKLKEQFEKETNLRASADHTKIEQLQNQISSMNSELSNLRSSKSEYENVKHQAQHVETFRSDLLKAREEINSLNKNHVSEIDQLKRQYESTISELNNKIDYLQMSPAKRKKYDELNSQNTDTDSQDGGSF